jgi:hypothetical protein
MAAQVGALLRHFAFIAIGLSCISYTVAAGHAAEAPKPLLKQGSGVDWWFVFKFNGKVFPSCAQAAKRKCVFGGELQEYKNAGQQYAVASPGSALKKSPNLCVGSTTGDPVGATFDQVYKGKHFYVLWNDQFYNDPDLPCHKGTACPAPFAHAKGMLAWNEDGEGFVMQVTTPNWPGSGNKKFPRERNGNTLGCITRDGDVSHNNILYSQHFFSLKLTKDDVLTVLDALQNAAVATDHDKDSEFREQVVNNGGPSDIQAKVDKLGVKSPSKIATKATLSTGVQVISKSAGLVVPPWQMVSAMLGGVSLRVATWYSQSTIDDTPAGQKPECWDSTLATPGAVKNVKTGRFAGKSFGLFGGPAANANHGKFGVSTTGNLAIFGDMNQEGALDGNCKVKQNIRGGLFFVVEDAVVAKSLRTMMSGPN